MLRGGLRRQVVIEVLGYRCGIELLMVLLLCRWLRGILAIRDRCGLRSLWLIVRVGVGGKAVRLPCVVAFDPVDRGRRGRMRRLCGPRPVRV